MVGSIGVHDVGGEHMLTVLKEDLLQVNEAIEVQTLDSDKIGLVCVCCTQEQNQPDPPYYYWNEKRNGWKLATAWKDEAQRTKYGSVGLPLRKEIKRLAETKWKELEKMRDAGTLDEKWKLFLEKRPGGGWKILVEDIAGALNQCGQLSMATDWADELAPGIWKLYAMCDVDVKRI